MKKLITIILLLIAVSTQAQDTIHKFINYGTPKQVHYIGIIKGNDTVWKEAGKGISQGFEDSAKVEVKLSPEEKELIDILKALDKTNNEITKFVIDNGGQQLLDNKQKLIGIIEMYQEKFKINLQELIKRISKK